MMPNERTGIDCLVCATVETIQCGARANVRIVESLAGQGKMVVQAVVMGTIVGGLMGSSCDSKWTRKVFESSSHSRRCAAAACSAFRTINCIVRFETSVGMPNHCPNPVHHPMRRAVGVTVSPAPCAVESDGLDSLQEMVVRFACSCYCYKEHKPR